MKILFVLMLVCVVLPSQAEVLTGEIVCVTPSSLPYYVNVPVWVHQLGFAFPVEYVWMRDPKGGMHKFLAHREMGLRTGEAEVTFDLIPQGKMSSSIFFLKYYQDYYISTPEPLVMITAEGILDLVVYDWKVPGPRKR